MRQGVTQSFEIANTTVPAGAITEVQYNNAGVFGASPDFTWDNVNKTLTLEALNSTATLGAEIVTNGTFTGSLAGWTHGGGAEWTWSAGTALHTAGNTVSLSQSVAVINNTLYLLKYTVSGAMAGSTSISINGDIVTTFNSIEIDQPGTYYGTWIANTTGAVTFSITPTAPFDSAFDDISIKPIATYISPVLALNDEASSQFLAARGSGTLFNLGIGPNSLRSNTTGTNNVALGKSALRYNVTGFENVALGNYALEHNGAGWANAAFGWSALGLNTSGTSNLAIGHSALFSNTSGTYNIAIGASAMHNNVSSYSNVAIGLNALYANVSGNYSVAIGTGALTNSLASGNTAVGLEAMKTNTTGTYNTAVGFWSLYSNTIGNDNDAFGTQALYTNTTGNENAAFGEQALINSVTSSFCTGIGRLANAYHTGGNHNTTLGYQAGVTETFANRDLTGSQNTWLGANSGPGNTSQLVNSVAVGYQSHPTASNMAVFGNSSITSTLLYGNVTYNGNIIPDATNGIKIGTATTQKIGFWNSAPVVQQTSAALTNNVTAGGSSDVIADFADLVVFANSAAAIRNDLYQLTRKVKEIGDALRLIGMLG